MRYQTNGIRVFVATNRSSQAIDANATTKATTIPSPIGPTPRFDDGRSSAPS